MRKDTLVDISNELTRPDEIGKSGISIAFMLSDINGNPTLDDKSYGVYQLIQATIEVQTNETDGSYYRSYKESIVPTSKCKRDSPGFKYLTDEDLSGYPYQDYFCSEWDNLTL